MTYGASIGNSTGAPAELVRYPVPWWKLGVCPDQLATLAL